MASMQTCIKEPKRNAIRSTSSMRCECRPWRGTHCFSTAMFDTIARPLAPTKFNVSLPFANVNQPKRHVTAADIKTSRSVVPQFSSDRCKAPCRASSSPVIHDRRSAVRVQVPRPVDQGRFQCRRRSHDTDGQSVRSPCYRQSPFNFEWTST